MSNNNQYSQYSSGPYQSGPAQESGYNYGNPYTSYDQHELQQYPQSGATGSQTQSYGYNNNNTTTGTGAPSSGYDTAQSYNTGAAATSRNEAVMSQQDFLSRVSHVRNEIRSLSSDVSQIATLHQRALSGTDNASERALDDLVSQTQLKNTRIRDAMRQLQRDASATHDGSAAMKKSQFTALNNDFKKELQSYLQEEQAYKQRYRGQIERQYRIVNPDASEEEVRRAADQDWGNEGVFQTALRTNRSGQASAVLGAVRARHNELLKIEQSITELAQMFQDLDTLVVQQDVQVTAAEEQTQQATQNLDKGNQQVDKGIKSARNRNKLKWWCLFISIIIVALAVGLGVGLYEANHKAAQTVAGS